jgi:hypothetical protein
MLSFSIVFFLARLEIGAPRSLERLGGRFPGALRRAMCPITLKKKRPDAPSRSKRPPRPFLLLSFKKTIFRKVCEMTVLRQI